LPDTVPGPNLDKIIATCNRALADKNTELEKLLREKENIAGSDQLDLLRSKIMIEIGRLTDAEKIIDRLNLAEAKLAVEAKLQKVIIHLLRRRAADALAVFKEIEAKVKKDTPFFNIYLALAFSSPEPEIRVMPTLQPWPEITGSRKFPKTIWEKPWP
jgi:hypothetical protein